MNPPRCPAAYLIADAMSVTTAIIRAAQQRGWPEPDLYADRTGSGSPGPALQELAAAIVAGRHDGLLLAMPAAGDSAIMRLLASCTKHGVRVGFIMPDPASGPPRAPVTDGAAVPATPSREPSATLARAQVDALSALFPTWRIWLDSHGWHACRRGGYVQLCGPGAPAFHVRGDDAMELAAQLCWQQAADTHFPQGCPRGRLAEEVRAPAAAASLTV
jgi:hypothetical protein